MEAIGTGDAADRESGITHVELPITRDIDGVRILESVRAKLRWAVACVEGRVDERRMRVCRVLEP